MHEWSIGVEPCPIKTGHWSHVTAASSGYDRRTDECCDYRCSKPDLDEQTSDVITDAGMQQTRLRQTNRRQTTDEQTIDEQTSAVTTDAANPT